MQVLQAIFNFFYETLLGCRHEHLTRPFTLQQQTYKVCLDCGRHLYYSADTMRPLSAREARRARVLEAGELLVVAAPSHSETLSAAGHSKAVA